MGTRACAYVLAPWKGVAVSSVLQRAGGIAQRVSSSPRYALLFIKWFLWTMVYWRSTLKDVQISCSFLVIRSNSVRTSF